ncbi:unnamed protein product [Amoebophrya sp. A120]|nr:unnamed protein product [Amoebophrya sp. A120]|eukprot:GSA120T00009264001.1
MMKTSTASRTFALARSCRAVTSSHRGAAPLILRFPSLIAWQFILFFCAIDYTWIFFEEPGRHAAVESFSPPLEEQRSNSNKLFAVAEKQGHQQQQQSSAALQDEEEAAGEINTVNKKNSAAQFLEPGAEDGEGQLAQNFGRVLGQKQKSGPPLPKTNQKTQGEKFQWFENKNDVVSSTTNSKSLYPVQYDQTPEHQASAGATRVAKNSRGGASSASTSKAHSGVVHSAPTSDATTSSSRARPTAPIHLPTPHPQLQQGKNLVNADVVAAPPQLAGGNDLTRPGLGAAELLPASTEGRTTSSSSASDHHVLRVVPNDFTGGRHSAAFAGAPQGSGPPGNSAGPGGPFSEDVAGGGGGSPPGSFSPDQLHDRPSIVLSDDSGAKKDFYTSAGKNKLQSDHARGSSPGGTDHPAPPITGGAGGPEMLVHDNLLHPARASLSHQVPHNVLFKKHPQTSNEHIREAREGHEIPPPQQAKNETGKNETGSNNNNSGRSGELGCCNGAWMWCLLFLVLKAACILFVCVCCSLGPWSTEDMDTHPLFAASKPNVNTSLDMRSAPGALNYRKSDRDRDTAQPGVGELQSAGPMSSMLEGVRAKMKDDNLNKSLQQQHPPQEEPIGHAKDKRTLNVKFATSPGDDSVENSRRTGRRAGKSKDKNDDSSSEANSMSDGASITPPPSPQIKAAALNKASGTTVLSGTTVTTSTKVEEQQEKKVKKAKTKEEKGDQLLATGSSKERTPKDEKERKELKLQKTLKTQEFLDNISGGTTTRTGNADDRKKVDAAAAAQVKNKIPAENNTKLERKQPDEAPFDSDAEDAEVELIDVTGRKSETDLSNEVFGNFKEQQGKKTVATDDSEEV